MPVSGSGRYRAAVNPAAQGKTYPDVVFGVEPQRVAAFRAVFGERGDAVPPTFLTAAEFSVFPRIVGDPELGLDFTRVVHAEEEYEWRRPLAVGETLTARGRIAQIREKGGHGFLTIETELLDPAGHLVASARATMIERGP